MGDVADLVALATQIREEDIRRVLRAAGASAALNAFNRDCQIEFAKVLLKQRAGTDAIRERLVARYDISERTAYYRLADAIKSLQKGRDGCSAAHDHDVSSIGDYER